MSQPHPPHDPGRPLPPPPYRPVDSTQHLPAVPPSGQPAPPVLPPPAVPPLPRGRPQSSAATGATGHARVPAPGQPPAEQAFLPGGLAGASPSVDPPAGEQSRTKRAALITVAAVVGMCLIGGLAVLVLRPGPSGPAPAGWLNPSTPEASDGPLTSAGTTDPGTPSPSASPSPTPPPKATGESTPAARPTTKRPTTPSAPRSPTQPSIQQGVRPNAPCSPEGAFGVTGDGRPAICRKSNSDGKLRWRAF
ncbi:hypothetical protein [Micromonospora zhanjiangensis]|uniref:Uncharacterized protein n=1 Tax=Micromonospora zhanjiangensis TaxID=1522057 RepID=A0ABV8KL58_9ACTN